VKAKETKYKALGHFENHLFPYFSGFFFFTHPHPHNNRMMGMKNLQSGKILVNTSGPGLLMKFEITGSLAPNQARWTSIST
jgi:hypothetical protein